MVAEWFLVYFILEDYNPFICFTDSFSTASIKLEVLHLSGRYSHDIICPTLTRCTISCACGPYSLYCVERDKIFNFSKRITHLIWSTAYAYILNLLDILLIPLTSRGPLVTWFSPFINDCLVEKICQLCLITIQASAHDFQPISIMVLGKVLTFYTSLVLLLTLTSFAY